MGLKFTIRKRDGVKLYHKKKSDQVRIHHKIERWGESSP